MTKPRSYCLCFIYFSSKITNFQKDLFFKEHSWRWRFSILFSILSLIVSVINYSHIWNKIRKSAWQYTVLGKCFWTKRLNSFHNLIFSQWGQLSVILIKVHHNTIVYYIIFKCRSLTKFSLISEDLFQRSSGMR